MLDTLGILVVATVTVTLVVALLSTIRVSFRARLWLAAAVGAWIGVAIAVTAAGKLPPLVFLAMFSFPLLLAALMAATPAARVVLAEIPVPLIVGLNAMRFGGFLFILLALDGRLSGPFPYSAGIGDMLTGLFALPVARLAMRTGPGHPRVLAWNAFGMLDLLVAVSLALLSNNGFPLQLIHAGVGSNAVTTLPWSIIPLVLVPTYLIGHFIVFVHARAQAASRASGTQQLARV